MGFGGGGTGSFSLPDHTHTATLQDGGSLEDLASLVDDVTLQTWVSAEIASAVTSPTKQLVTLGSTFSTTSTTLVDITGMSITVANKTNGKFVMSANMTSSALAINNASFAWSDDGVVGQDFVQHFSHVGNEIVTLNHVGDSDGQVVKLQCHITSTTLYVSAGAGSSSVLEVLEI